VPSHTRMREFDRDLIRGGHYGQRSCEPHLQAEHMAAPTNAANVKKILANPEPSTHGTFGTCRPTPRMAVHRGRPEVIGARSNAAFDPNRNWRRLTQGGQTEESDSGPRSVELLRPFLVTSAIRQRHAAGSATQGERYANPSS
jgi:hypothetical protein